MPRRRGPAPVRTFICVGCNRQRLARPSGRLPTRCDDCVEPKVRTQRKRASSAERDRALAKIVKQRKRINSLQTQRHQRDVKIAALKAEAALAADRVRHLAAELQHARRAAEVGQAASIPVRGGEGMTETAIFDEVETRAREFGPPGVDAVKRCLLRLRSASGAKGTADAADDLARALIVWARSLRSKPAGRIGEDGHVYDKAEANA